MSAAVRWVSYEPALGPVDFARFLPRAECCEDRDRGVEGVCGWEGGLAAAYDAHPMEHITGCPLCGSTAINEIPEGLSWVVVGGESGPGARPFNVEWARSVIRQGRDAGVPVFVKQLGAQPFDLEPVFKSWGLGMELRDRKGGDWSEWPEDLRVREMPEVTRG